MQNQIFKELIRYKPCMHSILGLKRLSVSVSFMSEQPWGVIIIFHLPNGKYRSIDHDEWWYKKTCEPVMKHSTYQYCICCYGRSWLIAPRDEGSLSGPCDVFSDGDDWLIKCCWVLKGKVYGFVQYPGATAEQENNKVLASFSTCSHCVFSQLWAFSSVSSRRRQQTSLLDHSHLASLTKAQMHIRKVFAGDCCPAMHHWSNKHEHQNTFFTVFHLN